MPKGLDGFLFASSTQFARTPRSARPDVTIAAGRARRQRRGRDHHEPAARPRRLGAHLPLRGDRHRPRRAAGHRVHRGEGAARLRAGPQDAALPGEGHRAHARSSSRWASTTSRSRARRCGVRLFRRVWHSTLRETSFATGQAKYVTEQEDVQVAEKTLTSAATRPLAQTFPITESGVYVVELFARDKLGRVQTLSADLYVGGPDAAGLAEVARRRVRAQARQEELHAGRDGARAWWRARSRPRKALVVVEEPQRQPLPLEGRVGRQGGGRRADHREPRAEPAGARGADARPAGRGEDGRRALQAGDGGGVVDLEVEPTQEHGHRRA